MALHSAVSFATAAVLACAVALIALDRSQAVTSRALLHVV
jgi:hypothetical protein